MVFCYPKSAAECKKRNAECRRTRNDSVVICFFATWSALRKAKSQKSKSGKLKDKVVDSWISAIRSQKSEVRKLKVGKQKSGKCACLISGFPLSEVGSWEVERSVSDWKRLFGSQNGIVHCKIIVTVMFMLNLEC